MNALGVLFHEKGPHKRVAKKEVAVMRCGNMSTLLILFVVLSTFVIPLGCGCEGSHDEVCSSDTNSHAPCGYILQMAPHQCGLCPQQVISLNNSNVKQGLPHKTFTRVPALLVVGSSFKISSSLRIWASHPVLKFDPTIDSLHTIVLLI
ncbi:MAG: hypothetical protein WBG50_19955 [Desulfomonilaceae bacterium]